MRAESATRLTLLSVALLLSALAWARPHYPEGPIILVAASTEAAADRFKQAVAGACEGYRLDASQLPLFALSAAELSAEDLRVLGITLKDLPAVAVVRVSSRGLFSGVVDGALLRRVQDRQQAAHSILKRWTSQGRAWLGLKAERVDAEGVARLKLPGHRGTIVTEVVPGSPAAKAGLRPLDFITAIDHRSVANVAELSQWVASYRPGETVLLEYWRDGQRLRTQITLGSSAK